MLDHLVVTDIHFSQLLQYIDKQFNDLNFISVLFVFFLVLCQRLHFSITKLLSHLEITEDLDSDYEKKPFFLSSETHLVCAFSLYILQNPQGKRNNSILDLNTLQYEKQSIT